MHAQVTQTKNRKGNLHMATKKCPHCSDRKKVRTDDEKKELIKRLRRAVTAALNSFNKELMACHMRSCVADDIRAGKDEAIDEFVKVMQKLMK